MTLIQTAIKDIYIGAGTDDYSAMQGPAPYGFHVPLNTERQSVYSIWTALGGGASDGTNFGIALKLPFAGFRDRSSSNVFSQGSYGFYWSSSRRNANYAYYLYFGSGALAPQSSSNRANGFSVRCFKNTPVIPTSSWTKLYGTSIESGGIFWNSTDGLISLSSDGQTWITIADKNLGATTVWNSGDALSETNCGKYYQRGNNYGFAWTGSVTTSSTQVDASNYGPGNYYSSSTFITYDGRWDTTDNGNLRGGETGVVKKGVSKVYIGSTQVRPALPYLCFTANTAGSTVKLDKTGAPTAVTLETSTDGTNWSTYTFGTTITLSNVWDKVYFRNTSETTTGFSINTSNYYRFVMTGSIAGSGDVTTLLNKNGTLTLSSYCFHNLFFSGTALATAPELPATNLAINCYNNMFSNCTSLTKTPELPSKALADNCYLGMFQNDTSLEIVPKLPATTLANYCYYIMFKGCSKIKLSTSQTGKYQTQYRIPSEGTGTVGNYSLTNMFNSTGGTFTGTPSINTTYYTSNTVV